MTADNQRGSHGLKADGTSYRVLVVDDSIIMRKILRKVLGDEQYEICGEAEDKKSIIKAVSLGARGYVIKPPDREILLEKIRKILK